MKKKYIYLIVTIIAILIFISIIRWRNRIYKKYDLTDDAKNFLQVYRISENGEYTGVYPYMYHTGVDSVKAAAEKKARILANVNGADGYFDFIPVSKIILANGKKIKQNPKKEYILLDSIKLQ